jgi:hypothetical protein
MEMPVKKIRRFIRNVLQHWGGDTETREEIQQALRDYRAGRQN